MKNKDIYLTDEQYGKLLNKINLKLVSTDGPYQMIDDDTIGSKSTTSNIGLCNNDFTELDTALFPDDFIKYNRKSMKYKKTHHLCPFDKRLLKLNKDKGVNFLNGCFYSCSLKEQRNDKEELLSLVSLAKKLFISGDLEKLTKKSNNYFFEH